jgi:hypothetical protein
MANLDSGTVLQKALSGSPKSITTVARDSAGSVALPYRVESSAMLRLELALANFVVLSRSAGGVLHNIRDLCGDQF